MAFEWSDLSEKQFMSVVTSNARMNIWHGAVRSSKTIMSIVRWIEYVKTAPNGKLLMIGKTERTLKRNILDVIEAMVGSKNYHFSSGKGEVTIYGRQIDIVGANDERSENKIRGMTLAGAYGDEITLWPESFFKMLMTRLSVRNSKFFGTTNPDSPYHWLKVDYLDKEDELDLKSYHFTLDDNPALDPTYVAALKKEFSGLFYKRFIEGLWVLAEGAIYDMFNEEDHVLEEIPYNTLYFDKYYVSVDYGTQNPCVFLLIGEHMTNGKRESYVIKEYYYSGRDTNRQKTDAQYSADLKEFIGDLPIAGIFIDPSAKSFITQLKQDGFYNVMEAANDVVDGIRSVATKLANNLIKIHASCKSMLREFSAYVWDPKSQKLGEDKPIKEYDHALDALRYYVYTREQAPVFAIY